MLISFVYFERGQLGAGIQFARQGVEFGDRAGMIASNSIRCELAWVYAYCGAFDQGYQLIDEALEHAWAHQPAWIAFPQASKVRMHLLQGDLKSAERTAGNSLLKPISIPYARYTIFLCLANIELAYARGEYDKAILLAEELLNEVTPLTRVDVPEVLRWQGIAMGRLNRLDEARQTLTRARILAEKSGSDLHLWSILADLAEANLKLGEHQDAESDREQARQIVAQIAESLVEAGLRESFLEQPRVRVLLRH